MPDIYSKSKRSKIMSNISGMETKPEIVVRKYLFARGFRYRKNIKILPGKPDIVLSKYKTIIFVHGCFWHGHVNCKASKLPDTRRKFWMKKISDNSSRDRKNVNKLRKIGWNTMIVWQCEISSKEKKLKRLNLLIDIIRSERACVCP